MLSVYLTVEAGIPGLALARVACHVVHARAAMLARSASALVRLVLTRVTLVTGRACAMETSNEILQGRALVIFRLYYHKIF